MLAYPMHLALGRDTDLRRVEVHPDGEHGKRFDIRAWPVPARCLDRWKPRVPSFGRYVKRHAPAVGAPLCARAAPTLSGIRTFSSW
jgi:hypothetical protein